MNTTAEILFVGIVLGTVGTLAAHWGLLMLLKYKFRVKYRKIGLES